MRFFLDFAKVVRIHTLKIIACLSSAPILAGRVAAKIATLKVHGTR
jgi:hypothetical protein